MPKISPMSLSAFTGQIKRAAGNSGKMGLGLAICKALVNAQGGKITAESAGEGPGDDHGHFHGSRAGEGRITFTRVMI